MIVMEEQAKSVCSQSRLKYHFDENCRGLSWKIHICNAHVVRNEACEACSYGNTHDYIISPIINTL